ncbi:MAG: hypothetical protein ACPGC9_01890, partial [Cytophagales bacterium]
TMVTENDSKRFYVINNPNEGKCRLYFFFSPQDDSPDPWLLEILPWKWSPITTRNEFSHGELDINVTRDEKVFTFTFVHNKKTFTCFYSFDGRCFGTKKSSGFFTKGKMVILSLGGIVILLAWKKWYKKTSIPPSL